MDSWLDRNDHPATRTELHYGARMIRCFVERPKSVHEMLANAVARRPHGLALICGEERLSYAELDALVGEAAGGLRALGVEKGDRVAMVLGNSIEFVVVLFAVARLGAVSVPLNIRHTLAENSHIIKDCAAKVVVHEFDLSDRVPAPGAPPSLKHAVAVRREGGPMLAELRGAAPVRDGRGGRGGRDRDDSLYIRHDRPSERRDAHAPQHRPFRHPLSRDDGADRG